MESDNIKKSFFIIDGYGQIYRSYFAFFSNPLRDAKGNNVSAVFGFFNNLMMLIRQYKPDYIAVALDSKGKTFRHEMYPEYKANREKTPEDLHAQIPVIVGILDAIGIKHFQQEGVEADDIIATVAKNCSSLDLRTVIVTGDKDLMQLVDDNVLALRPPRKTEREYRLCTGKDVQEIFGVAPEQICDYLTILGDSSDNVPGIDGIGEKGAVKLLSEYKTLASVYENIDKLSAGLQTKLNNAKDHLQLSHQLIELKNDLFTVDEPEFEACAVSNINWYNAIQEFHAVNSDVLVRSAKKFIISGNSGEEAVKPALPVRNQSETESSETEIVVPEDFKIETDNYNALVGYNLKEKLKELKAENITAKPYFDVMIAHWLLNSADSEPSFENICKQNGIDDTLAENEKLRHLVFILDKKLKAENLDNVFYTMEMPLVSVLADMETEGIMLDKEKLRLFETELETSVLALENDIYTLCGHPFNINSPKQLQEVLFTERQLPPVKKTKNGFSTDSDVLEELAYSTEDPLPAMLLRYRAISKLLSTYVVSLPSLTDSVGRIHTTFLQTGTATGRLSSKNPNLQNIPVRTDEGRKIRGAFKAKDGFTLLSADYAQIELAVLASISDDKSLSEAFINAQDVHTSTASIIFSEFPEMVTEEQRRIAKTINFGVIYGMSAFRLAGQLKISRKDAQNFITTYFDKYYGVKNFIEKVKSQTSEKLEVYTQLGHKRKIPDINSSNKNIKSAAERVAVNTIIQGTAAEIVKLAMLNVSKALQSGNYKSKILLQVHDEIILEVENSELNAVKEIVKKEMEGVKMLSVPIRVSISTGTTWGDL